MTILIALNNMFMHAKYENHFRKIYAMKKKVLESLFYGITISQTKILNGEICYGEIDSNVLKFLVKSVGQLSYLVLELWSIVLSSNKILLFFLIYLQDLFTIIKGF